MGVRVDSKFRDTIIISIEEKSSFFCINVPDDFKIISFLLKITAAPSDFIIIVKQKNLPSSLSFSAKKKKDQRLVIMIR